MARYRVAILGTGSIAASHIQALSTLKERAEVVAAVDILPGRAEAFSAQYAIPRFYTDARVMLEQEHPDLVQITTPPSTHYELIIRSLEAGANVLCEKPLCTSLAEIDHVLATEKRTGKACSSVFQWRFGSGGQHLKHLIETEALGRPLVGICQTTWFRDQGYYTVPWRGKWQTEGGGPTMGHGIHAMDFFLWLLGEWSEVNAMMGTLDRAIEVEDVSLAMVRFQNQALGSVVNSILSPRETTYLRFDFQKASVELTTIYKYTNKDWRVTPLSSQKEAVLSAWQGLTQDLSSSHLTQITALLDSLDQRAPAPAGTLTIRPTLEFISGLYKSAFTEQTIRRGSIVEGDPFYHQVAGKVGGAQ